jgi:regulator of replication initiation timing
MGDKIIEKESLTWNYGSLEPSENLDIVLQQLHQAHDNDNKYREIKNKVRVKISAVADEYVRLSNPEEYEIFVRNMRLKRAKLEKAQQLLRSERIQRGSKVVPERFNKFVRQCRRELRGAARDYVSKKYQALKEVAEVKERVQAIRDEGYAECKTLYGEGRRGDRGIVVVGTTRVHRLYGYTDVAIRDSVAQADKSTSLFDADQTKQLEYRPWDETGRIGGQLHYTQLVFRGDGSKVMVLGPEDEEGKRHETGRQATTTGLPVDKIFLNNEWLRFDRIDSTVWEKKNATFVFALVRTINRSRFGQRCP